MGLFKRDFWTDWTVWLAAFAIVAGVASVQGDYEAAGDSGNVANLTELVIVVAFQFALFGVLPASIRLAVRSRGVDSGAGTVDGPRQDRDRSFRALARPNRAVRLGAVIVVGLLLVGLSDWLIRNLEMSALVGAIRAAEDTQIRGDRELTRIADRNGSDWTDAESNRFEDAAAAIAVEAIAAQQRVEDVRFLPWHSTRAKSRYVAHSEAWVTWFTELSHDDSSDRVLNRADIEIAATWDIAVDALETAVPPLPLFKLSDRLDRIVSA